MNHRRRRTNSRPTTTMRRLRESVDLRTKAGRNLRAQTTEIMELRTRAHELRSQISGVVSEISDAEKREKALLKSMEKSMRTLEVTLFKCQEGVALIENVPKFTRPSADYKELYNLALEKLAEFSAEAAEAVVSAEEAMMAAKRAETKDVFTVSPLTEAIWGRAADAVVGFGRRVIEAVTDAIRSITRANRAGKSFVQIAEQIADLG